MNARDADQFAPLSAADPDESEASIHDNVECYILEAPSFLALRHVARRESLNADIADALRAICEEATRVDLHAPLAAAIRQAIGDRCT